MALAGSGAVAIWHDISAEGRDAFYAWHGEEHMPERVGIPGFRRGRRYVALDADLEFFNLYETATPAVLTGPDYLARLNAPTPRTVATVKHFRNVSRALCAVVGSAGAGEGGLVATWRWFGARDTAALRAALCAAVPALATAPGIAGAHALVTDASASAIETVERRARPDRNVAPACILLIEGWGDEDAFRAQATALAHEHAFARAGEAPALGVYRLQNALARPQPWNSRRPARSRTVTPP